MVSKKGKKKSQGKRKAPKVSIVKLSNKRLNKLAKQGKLKKTVDKKKLQKLLEERTKPQSQPHLDGPAEKLEQDIPIEEADYDYFATPGRDFSFLSGVGESEKKRGRKRKKDVEEEPEETYEKNPRKTLGGDKNHTHLLPIKTKDKGIIPRVIERESVEDEVNPEEEQGDKNTEEDNESQEEPLPPLSTAELLLQRQQKLAEQKQNIAIISSSIIESPEQNVRKLKELRLLMEDNSLGSFITVKKLAIVSLMEVFKDIIPGYRVRVATDKERTQAAKKETKLLRDFEDSLVNNYKKYLEFLENLAKGKTKRQKGKKYLQNREESTLPDEAQRALRNLAVRCLCELLTTHPHFNFRTNVIAVVVPFLDHNNKELSDSVSGYMKKLFRADKEGEITLEVVRLIGRIIKAKNFAVHPKVLNTFLALRIKEVSKPGDGKIEDKKTRRENYKKLSRNEKKRSKQMGALEKELQDAAVEVDTTKRLKIHTEIINMVFLTYFRILKQAHYSSLLSPVLEGLAKFALLINIDFFDDLFRVMKNLVQSGTLTYRESLHCVQTAFTILSGQGQALNVDPLHFYNTLYQTLFVLHAGESSEDLSIALHCVEVMLIKRRKQVSQQRVVAFIKRLCTLALQQEACGAVGILSTIRNLINAFPKSDILLDTENQGSGVYLPELEEPEHCNAHNTALYELFLLKKHYHPGMRRYSNHLIAGCPSLGNQQLPGDMARKTPFELMEDVTENEMKLISLKPAKYKSANKKISLPGNRQFFQDEMETIVQLYTSSSMSDKGADSEKTKANGNATRTKRTALKSKSKRKRNRNNGQNKSAV